MNDTAPPLTSAELARVRAFGLDRPPRRTKRRFAHELFPQPEPGDLDADLPYLFARGVGFDVHGTGWMSPEGRAISAGRSMLMMDARFVALVADALQQGLTGRDAWRWASDMAMDETGASFYERAIEHNTPAYDIKPYPCGPEPDDHEHFGPADGRGYRSLVAVSGRESDCDECTEEVDA